MSEQTYELQITEWEGHIRCVYINNFRIVGSKPWGGGNVLRTWRFTLNDLKSAFPELEIRTANGGRDE